MAKFLIKASYTADGAKGLIKEGGTKRKAAIQKLVEAVGGKVEFFSFAYGEADAYLIVEVADPTTILALSLTVNGSGAVRSSTVPLISPEEMDAAAKVKVPYQAPGD
jgi:uncharacterized protein with GYD domain